MYVILLGMMEEPRSSQDYYTRPFIELAIVIHMLETQEDSGSNRPAKCRKTMDQKKGVNSYNWR